MEIYFLLMPGFSREKGNDQIYMAEYNVDVKKHDYFAIKNLLSLSKNLHLKLFNLMRRRGTV